MSFLAEQPLASITSALVAIFIIRKLFRLLTSPLGRLAGPSGAHWFWGHELMAFERPSGDAYTEWIDTYGQTYKIKGAMFHPDILVTVDPGAITHMFKTYSYGKSSFLRTLMDRLMGKGLTYSTGEPHKRQRYQLSPFFTTQATRDMFGTITACAQTSATMLVSEISKRSGSMIINVPEWTGRTTLDIIGRFAFDYDFECGESDAAKVMQTSWNEQVRMAMERTGLIGLCVLRAFPWIVDLPIPAIKQEGVMKTNIQNLARQVIQRGPSEVKRKNLLTTLIGLAAEGKLDASNEELLDHISTLILVGHETTSGSLTWVLYELAKKPEYQKRLRAEIMQLGREPTYEDLTNGMQFLDAVMKEIFRHRPGSSHTERVALQDDVIRLRNPVYDDSGRKIAEIPVKAGQLIHIPSISLSHVKSVWGPDAEEFDPERWLDPSRIPSASETCGGWNGLFVFSEGVRMCIGYKLAILEFKVILSTYLRHFEFHDTGATISHRFAVTLQPYVVGEESKGNQLPLRVSLVNM